MYGYVKASHLISARRRVVVVPSYRRQATKTLFPFCMWKKQTISNPRPIISILQMKYNVFYYQTPECFIAVLNLYEFVTVCILIQRCPRRSMARYMVRVVLSVYMWYQVNFSYFCPTRSLSLSSLNAIYQRRIFFTRNLKTSFIIIALSHNCNNNDEKSIWFVWQPATSTWNFI